MAWVTVAEAARYAHRRRAEVESWVRRGLVFATTEGGRVRVDTSSVDEYLRRFPFRTSPTR